MLHVGVGCCDDPTDFLPVDGLFGREQVAFRTGLDLNHDQLRLCTGDQIEFVSMKSPVGMQNRQAMPFQIGACDVFARLSRFVFLGHASFSRFFRTNVRDNFQFRQVELLAFPGLSANDR